MNGFFLLFALELVSSSMSFIFNLNYLHHTLDFCHFAFLINKNFQKVCNLRIRKGLHTKIISPKFRKIISLFLTLITFKLKAIYVHDDESIKARVDRQIYI